MDYIYLDELYKDEKKYLGKKIKLKGWIRNHRKQKNFGFIYFSDGTAFRQLQLVYDNTLSNFEDIQKFRISSSIEVEGELIESMGTAKKLDPTKLSITTLDKTEYDPIAKILRKRCRDEHINTKVRVVSSNERPVDIKEKATSSLVPNTAGIYLASYVINDIIK